MREEIETGTNGAGLELGPCGGVTEVGAGCDSQRESVVVWSEIVRRMDLVKKLKSLEVLF